LSEIYDGLCIVVSEETGAMSAANRGMLVRYNTADELADPLSYIYHQGAEAKALTPLNSFLQLIGRNRSSDTASGAHGAALVKPGTADGDHVVEKSAKISEANLPSLGSLESEQAI
jgi:hypothetical protein